MTDQIRPDDIVPRRAWFERALRHLVFLAERHGWTPSVLDYRVTVSDGSIDLSFEIQAFGRMVVRRRRNGVIEATSETYDLERGLALFERYLQEAIR